MTDPADLYDDDPGITSWAGVSDAVAEMRAALAAAEARAERAEAKVAAVGEAIIDTCWKATPYGETEDGDVHAYILPKGTMHRLIGQAQAAGIPAAFRALRATPFRPLGEP